MTTKICLGIESTAHTFGVGIIDNHGNILANEKKQYVNEEGQGIKPYAVSQHHYKHAIGVLKQALDNANLKIKDIDVISFSQGPGLGPCLSVSAITARALSLKYNKPLVGVNHCVAHIEVAKTLLNIKDPLVIFTSGANTQIIVKDENRYKILGETLDIGIGNLFDSFARDLGYGFPGGPILDKIYFEADPNNYIDLPYSVKGMDMAFSGLLTSARKLISKEDNKQLIYSFMHTAYAMLTEVVDRSLSYTKKKEVVVIGGVAASKALKEMLEKFAKQHNITLHIPPMVVCLDNGLIIADLGLKTFLYQGPQPLEDTKINPKFRTDESVINW